MGHLKQSSGRGCLSGQMEPLHGQLHSLMSLGIDDRPELMFLDEMGETHSVSPVSDGVGSRESFLMLSRLPMPTAGTSFSDWLPARLFVTV